ncbi:MAG: hypothetical protein LQ350_002284 [Teloschistes chrysophthalmus]|nr:MAG: hypothetical protein LQ350_002284 [Niorma chrysophthalma]
MRKNMMALNDESGRSVPTAGGKTTQDSVQIWPTTKTPSDRWTSILLAALGKSTPYPKISRKTRPSGGEQEDEATGGEQEDEATGGEQEDEANGTNGSPAPMIRESQLIKPEVNGVASWIKEAESTLTITHTQALVLGRPSIMSFPEENPIITVTGEIDEEKAAVAAKWGTRKTIDDYSEPPSWAANAARYEWSGEFGDIGPADETLEKMLFHAEEKMEVGEHLEKLTDINVSVESENHIQPVVNFDDAGLHPVIRENVKRCGFLVPTPIQGYCLPAVLKNLDIIGIAQTGSGKTAAYLIPTISKLMGKARKLCGPRPDVTRPDFDVRIHGVRAEPLILVVAPTRELATQIFDEARRLCYRSMLRPCVAYGGAPTREQADQLRKGCDILIATPGRLLDFLQRDGLLSLSRVKFTVIDEADEFVAGDWESEMDIIMGGADATNDSDHHYLFFSATFNKGARSIAKKHLSSDHVRVRVGRAGSTHANVHQRIVYVDDSKKHDALWDLLMDMPPARTMIFTNWKKEADLLDDFLWNKGLPSTSIHSDRTQREREDAIRAFKVGKAPILITTGVSARGLDVKNTLHIINYDFPANIDEYVHRIGRTARIGNLGLATTFYNDKNENMAEDLVKLLLETKQEIPDFLEQYKPSGEELEFNDDSGAEDEGEEATTVGASADAGDGWGAGNAANDTKDGDDWGTESKTNGTNGTKDDWDTPKKTNGFAGTETKGGDSWNANTADQAW